MSTYDISIALLSGTTASFHFCSAFLQWTWGKIFILSSVLKIVFQIFLVVRRVDLVVAFAFLLQNFVKVVRTYEWYFVILWMNFEWWGDSEVMEAIKHHSCAPHAFALPPPCPHTACTLRSHLVKLSLLIFGLALPDSKYFSSDNQ